MRSGVASRLLLVALGGADEERLAQASRSMAAKLRASGLFASVQNGGEEGLRADREAFMNYRYVLSAGGRRRALQRRGAAHIARIGARPSSPRSRQRRCARTLPRDPTGELRRILERLPATSPPAKRGGVWFTGDGKRALLVAETLAGGFDAVAQEQAIQAVVQAVEPPARAGSHRARRVRRRLARGDRARRLAAVARLRDAGAAAPAAHLPAAGVVALCFVPVVSGLAVGTAAVSLAFGNVHAITLGFGATLVGEAVDYPSYACLNAGPGESLRRALERIWPTLRLAVLTTVLGGLTMLLSSFAGLAQLGLLSMTGVLVAGLVTRDVVPALAGARPVTDRAFAVPRAARARDAGSAPARAAGLAPGRGRRRAADLAFIRAVGRRPGGDEPGARSASRPPTASCVASSARRMCAT